MWQEVLGVPQHCLQLYPALPWWSRLSPSCLGAEASRPCAVCEEFMRFYPVLLSWTCLLIALSAYFWPAKCLWCHLCSAAQGAATLHPSLISTVIMKIMKWKIKAVHNWQHLWWNPVGGGWKGLDFSRDPTLLHRGAIAIYCFGPRDSQLPHIHCLNSCIHWPVFALYSSCCTVWKQSITYRQLRNWSCKEVSQERPFQSSRLTPMRTMNLNLPLDLRISWQVLWIKLIVTF